MIDTQEEYIAHVLFGENNDVTLDLCVCLTEYDLADEHVTKWDAVEVKDGEIVRTDNCISIISSSNPRTDKQVFVYYDDWTISGKWDTKEEKSERMIVYHCHNALFRFDVMFDVGHDPWTGDYEDLLK